MLGRGIYYAIMMVSFITLPVVAEEISLASIKGDFKGIKHIFLDKEAVIHLNPKRSTADNIPAIYRQVGVENITMDHNDMSVNGCVHISPYDSKSVVHHMGRISRSIGNNVNKNIEQLSFQPHFSGLKGPQLKIMRKDLERALVLKQGSSSEIFHNASVMPSHGVACHTQMRSDWDVEIAHHIDPYDSDRAPLIRSDLIVNNKLHFGGYFLGTLSTRYNLYENLDRDGDLRFLNRPDPVRQDVLAFAKQGLNLNRLMVSGFATPSPDTYIAGHAGFIEENFLGLGGEFLYRPYDTPLSFGAELWGTTKRVPYLGGATTVQSDNRQTSALLNVWYDVPFQPYSVGVSAGRFLDGDTGTQLRARYAPSPGWLIEGYGTYSNEMDTSLDHGKNTNWEFGLRLSMPLGDIKLLPNNSRQTLTLKPFARDKGQRIDNPYPLYDLTNPWQAKNIYAHWGDVVK